MVDGHLYNSIVDIHINSQAFESINESILISGCGRSGTTIVGKLLHSFDNVDYFFEPPLTYTILPLLGKISDDIIKIQGLYEEEFSDSGGPFVSYIKLNRTLKEALIVTGFANNPGKNKNRLLKELEIQILNTVNGR